MTLVPHCKNPRGCLLTLKARSSLLKASVAKAVQPNYTHKHDKKLTLGEAFKLLFLSPCQKIFMAVGNGSINSISFVLLF